MPVEEIDGIDNEGRCRRRSWRMVSAYCWMGLIARLDAMVLPPCEVRSSSRRSPADVASPMHAGREDRRRGRAGALSASMRRAIRGLGSIAAGSHG